MDVRDEDIAIIGLAGRFPGAQDVKQLWDNLQNGVESVRSFTIEEIEAAGVDPTVLEDSNYVNSGAPLDDVAGFDAQFFGFTPREAELTDPQHRLFLECAWNALEDAGYGSEKYPGVISVFGSVARNTYLLNHAETYLKLLQGGGTYEATLGSDKDYVATRLAHKLNVRGASFSIQAACSSGAIATHVACQALLNGDCDMVIVGGGRVQVPHTAGYHWVEGGIPSRDGHCRPFDAEANGCIYGSGMAVIVLKRLVDALEDSDDVYAVIKATAINNDGADKIGFTAPSVKGQSEVIANALKLAEIDPDTISYIEAHGTATRIGDPIEVAALTNAYRRFTDASGFCAIGSLKSNIGHLDAGAGVAALVKTALMLKHGVLVPSVNYKSPNPEIDFDNSPFYVIDERRDWITNGIPRRAGVSSFGLGGTNFHAILEQAPMVEPKAREKTTDLPQIIPMSAKSKEALTSMISRLGEFIDSNPNVAVSDVAFTLQQGRNDFDLRYAIAARSSSELADKLGSASKNPLRPPKTIADLGTTVFVFSGQGSQYPNMGQGLYSALPSFREEFDRCVELFKPAIGVDLRELLFVDVDDSAPAAELLAQTNITQPVLFALEFALAKQWMAWGFMPDIVIGHSVGELTAACLAGVLSLEDAVRTIAVRGQLMYEMPTGDMLAVPLPEAEVVPLLDTGLSLAAVNGPALTVVAGESEAVSRLSTALASRQIESTLLQTSHAFHSHMMDGALPAFREHMATVRLDNPKIPLVSNLTGGFVSAEQVTDPEYWVRHIREGVRFADGVACLIEGSTPTLIEIGPGDTFTSLARQSTGTGAVTISSLPRANDQANDLDYLFDRIGELWSYGYPINWNFGPSTTGNRIHLPGYPFEHRQFWLQNQRSVLPTTGTHEDVLDDTAPTVTANDLPSSSATREELINDTLKTLFADLSGFSVEELHEDATFVELGFDSLFLTRAGGVIQKEFEFELSFRTLIEDAPSIGALTHWLDERLPADRFQPAPAPISAVNPPEVATTSAFPAGNLDATIKTLLDGQIELLNQQVELVRKLAGNSTNPIPATTAQIESVDRQTPGSQTSMAAGPWKPINTQIRSDASPKQLAFIEALGSRLGAKAARSKAFTESHRSVFADPRAVAGFRQIWKELVFPVVADRSEGATVWDLDDNEYLDVAMGFGVELFGHKPAFVTQAVKEQIDRGFEIGPTSPLAGEVAELIHELTGMERVAFCNTGSEAVLAATRIARTVTGRDKIVFFSDDYHGIFDEMLARNISGTKAIPVAPGIPTNSVDNVLVLAYGAMESLDSITEHADEIAAVIVEPVQSRHPDLQPVEFLRSLRSLTEHHDIALVFDEIITGFRCDLGGAQKLFGIHADIVTYGKSIGGGFPIAVVTGSKRYMDALDGGAWSFGDDSFPEAGVTWFAGTFVRHPVALAAARASLLHLREAGNELQCQLNAATFGMVQKLNAYCSERGVAIHVETFSSLFNIKFTASEEVAPLFYFCLRDCGVYITEGRAAFLSTAHTAEDIDKFIDAFTRTVDQLVESQWLTATRISPLLSTKEFHSLSRLLDREIVEIESACTADQFNNNPELITRTNALCTASAVHLLRQSGVVLEESTVFEQSKLDELIGIVPVYRKLFQYLLHMLQEDDIATISGSKVELGPVPTEYRDIDGIAETLANDYPDYQGLFRVIRHCSEHYGSVLSGAETGVSVLFPGGNRDFIKQELREQTKPYRNLEVYEALVVPLISELRQHQPLRILEIGGGGGDITSKILPLLGPDDRYLFTDIGSTFVMDAKRNFKTELQTGIFSASVFDISKPPQTQGLDLDQFDIILGLNVVHATPDVDESLRILKAALAPGGILCLIELTRSPRWENLIWGVMEGWWYFDDAYRDLQPLLDIDGWRRALTSAGFEQVAILPREDKPRRETDSAMLLALEPARKVSSDRAIPLTDAQQEIWLAAIQDEDANRVFNITNSIRLTGRLQIKTLQASIQQLARRHPLLCGRLSEDGAHVLIPPSHDLDLELIVHREMMTTAELQTLEQQEIAQSFDLFQGPLIRFQLIQMDSQTHNLLLTAHHIVCDGWSVGNVMHDLGSLYRSAASSTSLPPPTRFSEYVVFQEQHRKQRDRAGDYWREQLEGFDDKHDLPLDRPRAKHRSYAAHAVSLELSIELRENIRAVGAKQGCTLFACLLTAYYVLLSRITEREDQVIGITAAGQFFSQMQDVVGHCINMLPLRLQFEADKGLDELLACVRTAVADAFSHHECTYGKVLQSLPITREANRPTLIANTFNFDPVGDKPNFGDVACDPKFLPKPFELYDQFWNIAETDTGLRIDCVGNAQLFEIETLQRRLESYREILTYFGTGQVCPVHNIPILSQCDRDLISSANSRRRLIDHTALLHGLFEQQADATPELPALRYENVDVTYEQLDERTSELANFLITKGARSGEIVGVCLQHSVELIVAFLAVLKSGAAYMPLDPEHPQQRLRFMIEDSCPLMVLSQASCMDQLQDLPCEVADVETVIEGGSNAASTVASPPSPGDPAYVIYTSGSTGRPKGVVNSHSGICNYLLTYKDKAGLSSGDTSILRTQFTFDVSISEIFLTLSSGGCLVITRPDGQNDPDYLASLVEENGVTILHFVPSLLEVFLQAKDVVKKCASLRQVIASGEPLSVELQNRFFETLPQCSLYNLYGPTETAIHVTHWECHPEPDKARVAIGTPIENNQIHILDSQMNLVPVGVPGELHIGGAQVSQGYLNRPELNVERFLPDPFSSDSEARIYRTGDLARHRNDGVLEHLGRIDDQIKLRGLRIELDEIAKVIEQMTGVRRCVVKKWEDAHRGELLAAYFVLDQLGAVDSSEIVNHARKYLPEYMIPAHFTPMDKLPLLPAGKVDRSALPEPDFSEDSDADDQEIAFRTETEKSVAAIWMETLDQQPRRHTNFFAAGGHSLLAVRLTLKCRDLFELDIPLSTLFDHPELAEFAEAIDGFEPASQEREVFTL